MGKNNAIQSDAEDQTKEQGTPELNPRNSYLEQLAQAQEDRMSEELAANDPQPAGDEVDPDPPVTETPPAKDVDAGPRKLKVKIDGEEMEVPEDEVIRGFQKDSAASKRLEQAAARMREVEERERLLAERESQLAKQTSPTETLPPAGDVVQEVVDAIYEGDEGKTKEALQKLVGGRQQTTQAPIDELLPKVTKQVKDEIERDTALEKFQKDYADIVSDPYLSEVADKHLEEQLKSGKPFVEAIDEAGKLTRDWLQKYAPPSVAEPDPAAAARAEKLAKKEQIDSVQTTNATAGNLDQQKEESPSETIAAMRKARGLPA